MYVSMLDEAFHTVGYFILALWAFHFFFFSIEHLSRGTGSGCRGVNFLHSSWYGVVLWICG